MIAGNDNLCRALRITGDRQRRCIFFTDMGQRVECWLPIGFYEFMGKEEIAVDRDGARATALKMKAFKDNSIFYILGEN